MQLANHEGRAVAVRGDEIVDIELATNGRFGPNIQDLYAVMPQLSEALEGVSPTGSLDPTLLGSPVPQPRQVFAIGINYRSHAAEMKRELPAMPATFTKFPSSLCGPYDDIRLSGDHVDWEVELVAVIGRTCDYVNAEEAWSHVAALTAGQDISDRVVQQAAGAQFSLAKSFRNYGPLGPVAVTPDEFSDPDDVALGCAVNGETVQDGRTSDLIFSVPELVSRLSHVTTLWPGDIIFTGTPSGVGAGRTPPRFLAPGDVIDSWIDGIGRLRNECRA